MKTDKKKIVFIMVIALTVVGMVAYYFLAFANSNEQQPLSQTAVPSLQESQKEYQSKLDAVDDLKEKKQSNAPSIYDEKLLDSSGLFDPDRIEKRRKFIVDSIYKNSRISYSDSSVLQRHYLENRNPQKESPNQDSVITKQDEKVLAKEMALEQQLFFASNPKVATVATSRASVSKFQVAVHGDHVVTANDRVTLRVLQDFQYDGKLVVKNTLLFGIVKMGPNGVFLDIDPMNPLSTGLKAFDLQDGREGIFIKNSFKAEVQKEITDDIIEGINIPGIPQAKGLKPIFRRSNRRVKVTILDGYILSLATSLKNQN